MGTGGRPRDPQLADRILTVATQVLATRRTPGFTADQIAETANTGKASIYRRWPGLHELLVDVVRELGVRDIDFGCLPGSARDDLDRLLTAACTGTSALAEAAVLAEVGLHDDLREAYFAGPAYRLTTAARTAGDRATVRGEGWSIEAVRAGVAVLQHRTAVAGIAPTPAVIGHVIKTVVLPAMSGPVPE
jgi:AcrR family transcriptional regulator